MARTREYDIDVAVTAAMQVFWQNGYEASSIQKLLEAMGINRGSLYTAFTDKEALFKYVLDAYMEVLKQAVKEQRENEDPGDPVGSLCQFFENAFVNQTSTELASGCLLFNTITELSITDPDLAGYAAEKAVPVIELFKYYAQQAVALGKVGAEQDPEVLTNALFTAFAGMKVIGKTGMPIEQLRKVIRATVTGLFR